MTNIIEISVKVSGTSPIKPPNPVKGNKIPIIINEIEEIYTGLLALLWKNGNFDVLIMCIPSKFETIL